MYISYKIFILMSDHDCSFFLKKLRDDKRTFELKKTMKHNIMKYHEW